MGGPWGKDTALSKQIYEIFYYDEPFSAIFSIKKPGRNMPGKSFSLDDNT